jgi:transcription elongation factor GreA
MNIEPVYLSEEGLRRLNEELALLRSTKRQEIAARLEYAKSLGDLSENAEYQEAKEEQFANEQRIAELEELLRRAKVIEKPKTASTVKVGVMQKDGEPAKRTYHLVSPEETSPDNNKISDQSPLGRSLLGKRKGDTVTVFTPRGPVKYTITNIH